MEVKWHGHSCFEFIGSGNKIIIDPHDGRSIGIKTPISDANIVLMTHNHTDHNAARIVKGIHKDFLAAVGINEVNDIRIEGFPSFHDKVQGENYGTNTIYKFVLDGITVCHCGDIGCIPEKKILDSIKGCDILFVPVGEVYTIPLTDLMEMIEIIKPNIIVPMHYRVGGLTIPLKTLDEFIKYVPEETIIYVGNEVELWPEDLEEFMGCWVFDY